MSRIIKCQVNDEYLLGSGVVIGAAGSHGDVILQLQFNDMWEGLSIMATFRDAMNENPVAIMLMPSMLVIGETRTYEVHVPAEAKRIAGRARLTLSGYSVYTINDNGTIKHALDSLTNTATAFFRVLESDSTIADDGSITDATFAQQAQAEINRAGEIIKEAADAVYAANEKLLDFDAAENQRMLAEDSRQSNENARITAETARAEAERGRVEAEEERKNNYAEIEMLVGSIDEAVNAILAIQDELLGIIPFFIGGEMYKADKDMTWGEWVDSSYNTLGIENSGGSILFPSGFAVIAEDSENSCSEDSVIISNCNYVAVFNGAHQNLL